MNTTGLKWKKHPVRDGTYMVDVPSHMGRVTWGQIGLIVGRIERKEAQNMVETEYDRHRSRFVDPIAIVVVDRDQIPGLLSDYGSGPYEAPWSRFIIRDESNSMRINCFSGVDFSGVKTSRIVALADASTSGVPMPRGMMAQIAESVCRALADTSSLSAGPSARMTIVLPHGNEGRDRVTYLHTAPSVPQETTSTVPPIRRAACPHKRRGHPRKLPQKDGSVKVVWVNGASVRGGATWPTYKLKIGKPKTAPPTG